MISEATDSAVSLRAISKSFPGMQALDDVTFDIAPGEFHALVGGNGSGKSTLIKVLAGTYRADMGGVVVVGDHHAIKADQITRAWSEDVGLRFVHQDLGLFPDLSVGENVFGPRDYPGGLGLVSWKELHRQADEALEKFGVPVRSRMKLGDISSAHRTLVAVVRCLRAAPLSGGGLLVLDEPTACLPAAEVDELLQRLRAYAEAGRSILYVSHRLDEVLAFSDTTTVLRDGRLALTTSTSELDRTSLTAAIVGVDNQQMTSRRRGGSKSVEMGRAPAISVTDLDGGPLSNINLQVGAGEVVAIAGLVGSGRTSLLENIFGTRTPESGTIVVGGQPVQTGSVRRAIQAGLALVSEDRAAHGLFPDLALSLNLSAASPDRYRTKLGWRRSGEHADAEDDIATFAIRAPKEDPEIRLLSGGNQQKAILARWMRRSPKALLLDEPTQGVDVGARSDIYRHIDRAVSAGAGVLLVTSDLDELLQLADRVLVLHKGQLVNTLVGDEVNRARVSTAMFNSELETV